MKKKNKKTNKVVIPPSPMTSPFDPLGSWTGNYFFNEFELPDQDVDDL